MFDTTPIKDLTTYVNTGLPLTFLFDSYVGSKFLAGERTDSPLIYFIDAEERYSNINLNYYQTSMSNYEFRAFIDFIGEERLEIDYQPSDFEMYYPEDED